MTSPRCRLHEYAPMMRVDTPEHRAFWDTALRAAQELNAWPQWMRDAHQLGPPRVCTCPDRPSDAAVRFSLLEME